MKIAVTGKGGVGKTTIIALIGRVLRDRQDSVLFIDADPDMNLATVLGIPPDTHITPIIELQDLIAERTGVTKNTPAPLFKMNPKVDDIPDRYAIEYEGFKLMVMGTIQRGGGGCACPENAFLKSLLNYMVIARKEWVLLDMEAGIEHLGRGTAIGVDHMLIIVEPNGTSTETAHRIRRLADDLLVKSVQIIGNKITGPDDEQFLREELSNFNILGFVPASDVIKKISLRKSSPLDIDGESLNPIEAIVESLSRIPVES
jgi:CO dehydrogenase maturation factor